MARKSEADHLRERLAVEAGGHRRPGRPARVPYSPLGESSDLEQGALAREWQNALACHLDAAKAKTLADRRFTVSKRRLAGARRALVAAGIDPESLQATENLEEKDQ